MNTTTFVFLATVWNAYPPQVYVADYGLTGEDCIAALVRAESGVPVQAANEDGVLFELTMADATYSCEVDYGQ